MRSTALICCTRSSWIARSLRSRGTLVLSSESGSSCENRGEMPGGGEGEAKKGSVDGLDYRILGFFVSRRRRKLPREGGDRHAASHRRARAALVSQPRPQ